MPRIRSVLSRASLAVSSLTLTGLACDAVDPGREETRRTAEFRKRQDEFTQRQRGLSRSEPATNETIELAERYLREKRLEETARVAFAYEWDWVTRAEAKSNGSLELTVTAQMNRGLAVAPCKTKQKLLALAFQEWQQRNSEALNVTLVNFSGRTLGVHGRYAAYYCP